MSAEMVYVIPLAENSFWPTLTMRLKLIHIQQEETLN